MSLRREQAEECEETLRSQINELSTEKRAKFFKEINKRIKDPDTYASMNYLFLGGFHHFYLEKWGRGIANLVAFILSIIFLASGFVPLISIGIFTLLIVIGVETYAMFFSQIIVQEYNNKVTEKLLKQYQGQERATAKRVIEPIKTEAINPGKQ